jgi:hypothetical protein
MAVVIEDTLRSANINESASNGSITRTIIITGITGDKEDRLNNALNDALVPDVGDAYPTPAMGSQALPFDFVLYDKSAIPMESSK